MPNEIWISIQCNGKQNSFEHIDRQNDNVSRAEGKNKRIRYIEHVHVRLLSAAADR